MQTWKVSWWSEIMPTFSWPMGGGFVPGGDWHEACENARSFYKLPSSYTVFAYSLEKV